MKIIKLHYLVILVVFLFSCNAGNKKNGKGPKKDFTRFVNPFIGTDEDGHTFPGVVLPNGMVQLNPDTRENPDDGNFRASSGYHYSDSSIIGFSLNHYSGTGRGDGGDFLLMPTSGEVQFSPGDKEDTSTGYRSAFSHANEFASPGYYKVLLDDYNIIAELTATKRVGLHKYTFQDSSATNVILDMEHGINVATDSAEIKIISDRKIIGFISSIGGLRRFQKLYFVAEFSEPFRSYGMLIDGETENNNADGKGKNVKAYFKFPDKTKTVLVKIATSKVDIEGADNNLSEIGDWDFELVKKQAKESWNKTLSKIDVESNNINQKKIFYTALYHTYIHPSLEMDLDGRYRSSNNKIYTANRFTNYTNFSLWDTFRGVHPLLTILSPSMVNDFIKTFIERYEHSGSLPIFELSGNTIQSMIGYHSLSVIADAYVKGIRDYDVSKAVKGMKELANLPWEDRNVLKSFGFIPYDFIPQSVSRTLEYCYDDWCVAQVVKGFDESTFDEYSKRGNFYKNIFSQNTGFMTPKNSHYKWLAEFNPTDFSKYYTQANAYQYTCFVPQDIHGLIDLMGGNKKFETWLDNYFSTDSKNLNEDLGQYNHGNEPSHHTAYLYNYAGVAWKTQQKVRKILTSLYNVNPNGLSGNDDAGQMSAWYVFSSMGFYSVTPGMDYYVIGSPLFDKVSITLENNKTFTIIANNNKPNNPYIQSLSLNGEPYTKSYIKHSDIINGGTMVFEMGDKPNINWGAKPEDVPYSFEYKSVSMPEITVENKSLRPDGVITFENSCTVSISSNEKGSKIYYTIDGTEPDTSSLLYQGNFKISKSSRLKAKTFKKGFHSSYATSFLLRKLDLISPIKVKNVKNGVSYEYRKIWMCRKVDDIKKYPLINNGVVPVITGDIGFPIAENYGVIYSAYILVPKSGTYTFYSDSDDGSVLFIDDILIVNNDGSHRRTERSGKIALAKGYHKINVKHYQEGGKPKLIVSWEGPGFAKEQIPKSAYFYE